MKVLKGIELEADMSSAELVDCRAVLSLLATGPDTSESKPTGSVETAKANAGRPDVQTV